MTEIISLAEARITRADVRAIRPTFPEMAGILARNLPRLPRAERMRLLSLALRVVCIRVQLLLLVWA
jgi:hypothetical protein